MTMDIGTELEEAQSPSNYHQDVELDKELETIIKHLTGIEEICFKSQQRGEADLTEAEKFKIAAEIFSRNKLQFLIRFGDYFHPEHLDYFRKFATGNDDVSIDMSVILGNLATKAKSNKKSYNVKNRRYEALKQMIFEDKYFSEIEMMKRNPLLYDQLVGRYLTAEEKKERDKYTTGEQSSFVKILMEGIERDDAEVKRKDQEKFEDNAMEESDSDDDERSRSPIATRTLWGEFENEGQRQKPKLKFLEITPQERLLLKQEFVTTMYQSFLDGTDEDFDYSTVDCNAKYDSVETIEHDEEDKYFDSEEPAEAPQTEELSEDELDIFMSALNDNPAVRELSDDLRKVNTNN